MFYGEKVGVKKFVVTSSIASARGNPSVKGEAYNDKRMAFFL